MEGVVRMGDGGKGSGLVMRRAKMLELGRMRADHTCGQCPLYRNSLRGRDHACITRQGIFWNGCDEGVVTMRNSSEMGSRPGRGRSSAKDRTATKEDKDAAAGTGADACTACRPRDLDERGRQDEVETGWISCCGSKDGPSIRSPNHPPTWKRASAKHDGGRE